MFAMRSFFVGVRGGFTIDPQYAVQGERPAAVARRFGVTVNRLYGIKHALLEQLRKLRTELDSELREV